MPYFIWISDLSEVYKEKLIGPYKRRSRWFRKKIAPLKGKSPFELKECKTLCPTAGGVALLDLKVDKNSGKIISVEGAKPVKTDVLASNGVIHVIDAVMVTPMRTEKE